MKKFLVFLAAISLVFGMVGSASATTFDFNVLPDNGSSSSIGAYMTNQVDDYYGTVTVSGARSDDDDWTNPSNTSTFIRTTCFVGGDFELLFSDSIYGVSGLGYVFDATSDDDFYLAAYGSSYTDGGGTVEDPDAGSLVGEWSIDFGTGEIEHCCYGHCWTSYYDLGDDSQFNFSLGLGAGASLLVFSDAGYKDVGIDDLSIITTAAVPEPSTMLLLGAGLLGLVGLGRKKFFKKSL